MGVSIKNWFCWFLGRVDGLHGRLLGPLWADPAEILRGKHARVWLRMMQILLGHVEVRVPRSPSTRATWEPGPKPAKISF